MINLLNFLFAIGDVFSENSFIFTSNYIYLDELINIILLKTFYVDISLVCNSIKLDNTFANLFCLCVHWISWHDGDLWRTNAEIYLVKPQIYKGWNDWFH